MNRHLIDRADSFLVLVDIQEKLAPAISVIDRIIASASALLQAAQTLGVPVVLTEHCADRIGHTLPELLEATPAPLVLAKSHFDALAEEGNRAALTELSGRRPIVCGTETHVCVLQTVFGLLDAGFEPLVVADAVGSRKALDKEAGLARMRAAEVGIVTSEMVIFEWLRRADSEDFRALLPVIKALGA